MLWFFLLLAISVVFFLLAKRKFNAQKLAEKDPFDISKFESKENFDEANGIALKIKTQKQLAALDEKIMKIEEQSANAISEKRQQSLDKKVETLKLAYDLAFSYLSYWQFIVDLELDTTLDELNLLGKKISNEEKLTLTERGAVRSEAWFIVSPDDEFEALDHDDKESLKFLTKLRKIVESEGSTTDKDKEINALVDKNKIIAANWFDIDHEIPTSEQLWEALTNQ
ncbi:hypothetical protein BCU85_23220 [Vibrio lentus]|uniref:hypothetical protein n=1 Tax=Vibrio lentus TaxID=136468 RepID=UPI000C825954|nr:hypothetical protein [Vibrio lentus]MCC4815577.1 hypothetical protein [Vibrio lentus]PMG70895.1 hypothetical protein BCU85_23220 [Vibrio lentus]PMK89165.1 hypothetical protein BCT88_23800 [Vibrio lentus]PML24089.1 hypothetical protein BCT80_22910 [Vibrio lentus]PMM26079.1 hypothetical protein BCT57_05455 [Vibrio lentus]